ncbi:hypothetical protein [Legionella spiritensis]|uniref:hypothetical protein n=1 Tax=Legionella spiritensis TaxID=452 RepID=UPI0007310D11|nr:hypothetical protein [Legionella spiritensis]
MTSQKILLPIRTVSSLDAAVIMSQRAGSQQLQKANLRPLSFIYWFLDGLAALYRIRFGSCLQGTGIDSQRWEKQPGKLFGLNVYGSRILFDIELRTIEKKIAKGIT